MADDADGPFNDAVLQANAWCGEAAVTTRDASFDSWGMSGRRKPLKRMLAPQPVEPGNWRDPAIGWGIILPDSTADAKDKARALDAPECVRTLLARRGDAPVFRYRPELPDGKLRRYAPDGAPSDPAITGARGNALNEIPQFLLILGSPAEIPWALQYRLQLDACVGRLDLDAAGLERYVDALLSDWTGSAVQRTSPLVWASDHGAGDISRLMRRTISDRLAKAFSDDGEFNMTGGFLTDAEGTHAALVGALATRRPAFVATSSHGATFPLNDTAAMAAQLGLPIDRDRSTLSLASLIIEWSPLGTIWYSHACCSAGADASSSFMGAATDESTLARTLTALQLVGATSAPLPRLLLGGAAPARAFIGHVEPTFDWTLRDPVNGQTTTAHIIEAFYNQLHLKTRPPLGLAMQTYYRSVGGLWRDVARTYPKVNRMTPGATATLSRLRLIASDLESMVLLGDPTVTLG